MEARVLVPNEVDHFPTLLLKCWTHQQRMLLIAHTTDIVLSPEVAKTVLFSNSSIIFVVCLKVTISSLPLVIRRGVI